MPTIWKVAVIGPLADSGAAARPWCFAFDLDETVTVLKGCAPRESIQFDYARYPARPADLPPCSTCGRATRRRIENFDDEAGWLGPSILPGRPTSQSSWLASGKT